MHPENYFLNLIKQAKHARPPPKHVMILLSGLWITNSGVPTSKPLYGLKAGSAFFILLRSIKWVPGTLEDLVVKSKLSCCSGSAALRQLNPTHRKEA